MRARYRFYTGHTLRQCPLRARRHPGDGRRPVRGQIERYAELPKDVAGLHNYCDEIEAEGGFFKKHESAEAKAADWVFQKGKFTRGRLLAERGVRLSAAATGTFGWMLRLDDLERPVIGGKSSEEAL